VTRFGLCTFGIGLLLSLLVLPWVELSWWKVFRRCVSLAAALSLWICIRMLERRPIRSYGLSPSGAGKRQLASGLAIGATVLMVMFGLGLASGVCRVNITSDHTRLWGTVLGFLPAALLVSVLEELVFRGLILQQLLRCSKPLAVIGSSVLYAFVHLKTTTIERAAWLELVGLSLLGGVLALSYLRTRQLYLAIGLHAILAYAARTNKLLLEFTVPSLSWLVGTNRLVNGVANWMALLVMGGLIVLWTKVPHTGGRHHVPG
jgi:membrane protease YdiL (CAAX protease family)